MYRIMSFFTSHTHNICLIHACNPTCRSSHGDEYPSIENKSNENMITTYSDSINYDDYEDYEE